MSHEIVHTIGSTIYFVFFLLFLWMRGIPRTNPGAGWWALAMLAALVSRLALVALLDARDGSLAGSVYAALNVIEKLCLLIGLAQFLGVRLRLRWLYAAALAVEGWVVLTWWLQASPLVRGGGVALFNAAVLFQVAWLAHARRGKLASGWMEMVSLASVLLALHWIAAYPVIALVPDWGKNGFLLGTLLVLVQYFGLLGAILLSFQTRLLEAESRALDMAFQDPLTGLSNQRYMSALFEKALVLANRPHQLAAVIYIDLDDFKRINDRAGHRVGDEVLKGVASRLRKATRSTDICARIGGDEFVAICTQLEHPDHADAIAAKLVDAFDAPFDIAGKPFTVGVSIGVSLYPQHGDSLATLLEHADRAMYRVKGSGKHGYRMHGPAQAG